MEHGQLLSAGSLRPEPGQRLPVGTGRAWRGTLSPPRLGTRAADWAHPADRGSASCAPPRINSEPALAPPFPAACPPSPSVPLPQRGLRPGIHGVAPAPGESIGFSGDVRSHAGSFGHHPQQSLATRLQSSERRPRDAEASFLAERTKMWGAVAGASSGDEAKPLERTAFSVSEETPLSSVSKDHANYPSFFPPTSQAGTPAERETGLRDPAGQGRPRSPGGPTYPGHLPSPVSFASLAALRQHGGGPATRSRWGAGEAHSEESKHLAETRSDGEDPASSGAGTRENPAGFEGGHDPAGPRVSSFTGSRLLESVSQVYIPEKLQCEPQVVETVITVPRVMYEQKITEVPQVMVRERVVEVPQVVRKEKVVTIPKIEIQEKIVELPVIKYVDKVVEVPQYVIAEKFISTDEVIRQEKIVPIPKIEVVEKIIQTPKVIQVEKIVDVPRIEYREVEIEKVVEVPQVEIQYVEREVPVPQRVIRHVHVDKIVEVRQKKIVEKIVKIPVPRYVEVPKYIEQPVPREKIVRVEKKIERKVPTPQPQEDTYQEVEKPVYVTKYIERRVPVPTERVVEEHVQVEVPREVIVKKPYDVVRLVEKQVEVAVPFVSGDPLILTAEGYIPFQEFARKSQVLTPKDRQFYERQSEALGSVHAPTWDQQSLPSPARSFSPASEVASSRGAQARLPEEVAPKGTSSSIGALSQTTQQSAYPLSPLNSPTSNSTCSGRPHLSLVLN
ncbi:conserved hypothetical protein [Neospora caninum Liverpool]|uniref:Alveolin domain containing intermediate filament IMC9 n=1 Tax=Neospora caninum (strain Liverpool) TaxID=572307 RepID=F0VLW2_NEOCL|nr:conserved hypothetical protein [Neospora caninum Liverpool]CBZ54240.1 conserved hypothetical protein [Neospora caninum Liverpool]CEL68943.1 TPA: alveolin domain containing intermediate filament IMC9 [Neospora caninum Liverpool]|eukprot:XP_003884271.1 conserved hypothetical protein [Neospora caninum Liverpool]